MIGSGEKCRFKKGAHEPVTDASTWRWNVGIWLGIDLKTGQYILWDGNNIMYARTFIRMIDSQKWCSEDVAKVRATPWSVHVPIEPDVVARKDPSDDRRQEPDAVPGSRRTYIKPSDIEKYGFTSGCRRCEDVLKSGHGETSKPHSEKCRKQIMVEIAKTPEVQA